MRIFFNEFSTLKPTLIRLFVAMLLFVTMMAQERLPRVQAQGTPQLILTKTIEGGVTTAQVGDMIRYRIRFECSSLVGPCGQMEITDVLQNGLIYLPPPNSSVPSGFGINYDSPTRTITITKDDNNLLDGSQYDAVIAVRVDYDLRPLPAIIDNQVNGRIDPPPAGGWINATPASAPPITIGTVTSNWTMTKSLFSPRINPTVDTDVTYQIQLCPATVSGNVALRNITITDTLPVGAIFVFASNGGTEASGVVTWPTIAGPIYPPSCVTRYVTIRYPSSTFSVGNNVTNTASANGVYTDSSGGIIGPVGVAIDPIAHPIDPISEVPSYSKGDVGDPVGIDGTGRFVIDLNTNGTNYPSNSVVLIDNLPPELQVAEVTSGGWDAAFDYVRAYIEYSTNYGSSYTAFPGQPVGYNANTTYTAPAANITNVRWRFEYDSDGALPFDVATTRQGLPYTWEFTTSPQIRVTPRATATIADPPSGAAIPVAVAGQTYDNCLQVSRINSSGNPVTDPCDIEQMTVEGNFVSLRTYKSETPGASWDDLDDPNINTFTGDSNLLPGDTLRYTITVEVTERSSAPLIDPTILDTLPADLVFVRNGIASLDGTPLGTQPAFSQPGANQLLWEFSVLSIDPLSLGSHYLTVEFFARIPRGQTPGTRTNNLYVITDSVDALCETGTQVNDNANGDIDGDGDTTDPACENPDTYVVERSAALRGEKWIRSTDALNSQVVDATTFLPSGSCPDGGTTGLPGGGSNPFTRYPCISQAYPEGMLSPGQLVPPPSSTTLDDFEYNLRIFNDGNVDMLSYVLYDILPYVGDTGSGGTLSGSVRLSEFRPTLRGPVEFISGPGALSAADFTIEYNNTTNPCRPEVFNQPTGAIVPGGCNNIWTTTWSTSARSYRIRLNAGSFIPPATATAEVRFGVPMYIPADAPVLGTFDADDAQSLEVAWNSFSHVGSYDSDPHPVNITIQDLLASEPRKVGITIPEVMSVGNRVWRDSDNSGTINPPDDTAPGIAGVTVNLYRDVDGDGIADGAAIATTTTDSGGYYLFSNILYDSANMNNNRYIIGIPTGNFLAGQPLESLRSSTGTPVTPVYTNPPSNNGDRNDNGIDPVTPGLEVFSASFILQPNTEPITDTDLSANDRDGPAGRRRGLNGERDNDSDLTLDFGFFGGIDVPFSIGNHVWYDDGSGGGVVNDGIRQANEPPVAGVDVRLYRDGNGNGVPEASELIRTDITDVNGFYLFDNLDPGPYYVEIPASEFSAGQPLAGWYSSQPTGTETTGVNGGTTTADIDSDDNGINTDFPETNGVFSGVVVLTRGVNEPTGETHLSNQPDPDSNPATPNLGINPTEWDGSLSRGRYGETDETSNLTIDFGFIPPMSLGNRVWIDEGAGTLPFRAGYNNGLQGGTEVGVAGVRVQLWRDTNGTPGLQIGSDTLIRSTTTDADGYYLFDRLQPGDNYYVHIPVWNFAAAGRPLRNFVSSFDANQATAPADDAEDTDDNGIDSATPATTGITSPQVTMAYNTEPTTFANETDINTSGVYGPQNRGNFGQADANSNLTIDFGFIRPPRSIGNRLWLDDNNNGQVDAGEGPVPTGVRVSLYLDANGDNQPDDLGVIGDRTDDWLAYDLTDANGYYLFDDLPPTTYIVGVDHTNFATSGLLEGYNSSTGHVDNATNNTDNLDNGVDRLQRWDPTASPHGILSTHIDLTATPVNAPTGEVGSGDTGATSGFNPTAGDGPSSRGRFGETDANSDLTIDLGFFQPMSIGNRVFLDDGAGGGTYNNGIMDGSEIPIANVRVELYRDVDANGVPDASGFVGFDVTDTNGYYLFDNVAEGSYVVFIPSGNFAASFDPDGGGPLPTGPGALLGFNSSIPTGTENSGVGGNPYTPNTDRDDNGVNVGSPATSGVRSGAIALVRDSEPSGEIELSGQADPGAPASLNFSPTGWDGPVPGSRGRWEESDNNSNLTIDFGFIPVFSLGNRVWFDTDNSSTINGAEVGINGVTVQLFASDGVTEIPVGLDGIFGTADDAPGGMQTAGGGYYLFNNLPAGDYIVVIPASNFSSVLQGYWSSATVRSNTGAITETTAALANSNTDSDDNGTLQTSGSSSGAVASSIVTLGPATNSEPAGESDLSGGQGQPDAQANMTVDFGFYTIQLGDLVWGDVDNSGAVNGAETGIVGVDVELWSSDGTLPLARLATDTTDSSGLYSFTGLPAGDYIVRIPATQFEGTNVLRNYRSSTGGSTEPAPDADVVFINSDDNGEETGGILGLGGYIQIKVVTLTPAGEESVNDANGLTTENRVDFGVFGGPQVDLAVTKDDGVTFYIAGGTLTYTVTVSNTGPADVTGLTVNDARPMQISSWDWACTSSSPDANPATYGCTADATNPATFTDTLDLPYGASVTYTVVAQVVAAATGALGNTVTVTAPVGYTEIPTTPNNNIATDTDQPASLNITKTDDLTVVSPGATLTYNIVLSNTGAVNLSSITVEDVLPSDVTFQSATPAPATAPASGVSGGTLTWTGISLASGTNTAFAVTVRVNDAPSGAGFTNNVTATDGNTGATATGDDTDTLAITNAKSLVATNAADSTTPQVLIGEILTYQISLIIPPGTLNNLRALDELEEGLAFDECLSVSVSDPATVTTTLAGGFADACPAASGDSDVTNSGHNILFDFGDVSNTSGGDQTITVQYTVDVLDIASNVNGVTGINNHVTWTWIGGSREASAQPLEIVEPDMSILKYASPSVALLGSTIAFTIDIEHTAVSAANAYDVVVTDQLPTGLEYVGNVTTTGLAYDRFNYDTATSTITFEWDVFPLLATSSITFEATFVGPPPVINEASVAWTSIPLDPGVQSNYNANSTERFYDPLNPTGVNSYSTSSSVTINRPPLPKTGFAPGRITVLPVQPKEKGYRQLDALILDIPRLGVTLPILGIPATNQGWDLTWLSNQAGWLEGTAYPTWEGNTGLTAHTYLADGTPGPFIKLGSLSYGDRVYVHANGNRYTYAVREVRLVGPRDISVLRHEEYDWITLITCREYDEKLDDYKYRVVVRAVLVKIEPK